jgi:hypothetical protein
VEIRPALVARPVNSVAESPTFNRVAQGSIPYGPRRRRWRNGTAHLAPNETAPGSSPGRRAQLRWSNRTSRPHGARNIWPHRLMARILAFQAEGDGSEPSGATARWCNGNMPAS